MQRCRLNIPVKIINQWLFPWQIFVVYESHHSRGKILLAVIPKSALASTLPETNIALENPPFWWYLPGNLGIFYGYVSLTEGSLKPTIVYYCLKWFVGILLSNYKQRNHSDTIKRMPFVWNDVQKMNNAKKLIKHQARFLEILWIFFGGNKSHIGRQYQLPGFISFFVVQILR